MEYLEQLRSFRPKHTVLEEEGKNGTRQDKKTHAQLAMEEKRRTDQEKITAYKKKHERMAEEREEEREREREAAEAERIENEEERTALKREREGSITITNTEDETTKKKRSRIRSFQDPKYFLKSVQTDRAYEERFIFYNIVVVVVIVVIAVSLFL